MKRYTNQLVVGAGYGVAVALAYFMVEFAQLTLVPAVRQSGTNLGGPFWHAMGILAAGFNMCEKFIESTTGKREFCREDRADIGALSDMLDAWPRNVPAAKSMDTRPLDSSNTERPKSLGYAQ